MRNYNPFSVDRVNERNLGRPDEVIPLAHELGVALDSYDENKIPGLFVGVEWLLSKTSADDVASVLNTRRDDHFEVQVLNLVSLVIAVFAPRP